MPVYNGGQSITGSIDSVLSQTYTDLELVIVDDGSTDEASTLLAALSDPRVRVIRNRQNVGIPLSLNIGLEAARSRYIARLDADDRALPSRLERQVSTLDRHPEIGILGTGAWLVPSRGGRAERQAILPLTDLAIRWRCLVGNPFTHPSVMLRRDLLVRHGLSYNQRYTASEDYDLWTRMLRHTTGRNLEEPLVQKTRNDSCRRNASEETTEIAERTIAETLPGFPTDRARIRNLVTLFLGEVQRTADAERARVDSAHLYLDLFGSFAARHHDEAGLPPLAREAAFTAAQIVSRHPRHKGWLGVVQRALQLDPQLPLAVARYLPGFGYRRLCRVLART
jgi:glycosyltransferase involved in cell wall biosynthesis